MHKKKDVDPAQGRRIAEVRRRLRLTQEEVARRMGMTVSAIKHLEHGRAEVSPQLLERFASWLGVPLADLLTQTQLGLAIVASSRSGGPHVAEAIEILECIAARLDREPTLMGFAWRMPVLIGLSSAYRQSGEWTKAEAAAQEACELAATSGERTWLALAWMARAERALAEGEIDRAHSALDRAVTAADEADAPLAAWRVHACAARTTAAHDRSDRALDHQSCAASVIARLAASLGSSNHLRQTFLDSDDVRAALSLPV